jgi:hypothetical protein
MFTEQLQAQIQMAYGETAVKFLRNVPAMAKGTTMLIELESGRLAYIRQNINGSYTMVS